MNTDSYNYLSNSYYGSYCNVWEQEHPSRSFEVLEREFLLYCANDTPEKFTLVASVADHLVLAVQEFSTALGDFSWMHGRTFCSAMKSRHQSGVLGPGWLVTEMPFLIQRFDAMTCSTIGFIGNMASVVWFDDDLSADGNSGGEYSLQHDFVDQSYRLQERIDRVLVFHNFDNAIPRQLRGRLKGIEDQCAAVRVSYGENNQISEVKWKTRDGKINCLKYLYGNREIAGRLSKVILMEDSIPTKRTSYSYDPAGRKLLRSSHFSIWDATEANWQIIETQIYKYNKNGALNSVEIQKCGTNDSTQYKLRYHEDGRIKWINHDGPGMPPIYLE